MIFNNGVLISLQTRLKCIFNTDVYSLEGKLMNELLTEKSMIRIQQLEPAKKLKLALCAKTTHAVFQALVSKIKFSANDLILIYTEENLNVTNSDENPYLSRSVLEQMMNRDAEDFFKQIDSIKTTRNLSQIKQIKDSFARLFQRLNNCINDVLEISPIEKNQFEPFNFALAIKNYLYPLQTKYPDRFWVSFQNYSAACVLGNRHHLIQLAELFLTSYMNLPDCKIIVQINLENDTATAEFTVLASDNYRTEVSEELIDFKQLEMKLLAQKAGCNAELCYTKDSTVKLTLTYDSFSNYRLCEPEEEGKLKL